MKRLASILLSALLAFSMTGCWGNRNEKPQSSARPSQNPAYSTPAPGSEAPAPSYTPAPSCTPDPSCTPVPEEGITNGTSQNAQAAAAAAAPEPWALRLVNSSHPLPEDFEPATRSIAGYDQRLFDVRAADQLEAMLTAAQKDGSPLYLVSGYRSIRRQTNLFERKVQHYLKKGLDRKDAETAAEQVVARPGCSEHNLGLAADIVSANWYEGHTDLSEDFENTDAFVWLQNHAAEYGFVLRYPKGKDSVTGVSYEPWHYRYVGQTAAAEINQAGLALEEYCLKKGIRG